MGHRTLTFSVAALQRLAGSILEAVGTPPDLAGVVAASLVTANLTGHDSHGVMRLMSYVSFVRAGRVKPAQRPLLCARHGATAVVDGGWGWGQPAARLATETAMALAAEYGIGAVTVRASNHIGRLGEYVESMARAGMMGLALCNAGPAVGGVVALAVTGRALDLSALIGLLMLTAIVGTNTIVLLDLVQHRRHSAAGAASAPQGSKERNREEALLERML